MWINLGSKQPTLYWQLFDVPVIGIELFRVKNSWSINPYYRMRAYLGQFFGTTEEVLISKTIYPFEDLHQTVELLIPEDLKNAGVITRYIGVKLAYPRRNGAYPHDWLVSLDEYSN